METATETKPRRSLLDLTSSQYELIAILEESGGELTPEIEAQLTINREALDEKICAYQAIIAKAEGKISTAKEQVDRLNTVKKKYEAQIERLEYFMLEALKVYGTEDSKGIFRLEALTDENVVSLSTRKSSSVHITDESQLPPEYWRVPELVAAPDKKLIKEDLDAKKEVPGAVIVEKLNLVIK